MSRSETTDRLEASRRKLVIGISGGIASGKSLVANLLKELGAVVIDSDVLIHEELAKADVIETLRGWWGDRVLRDDGSVDRRVVGEIVFRDKNERLRLEGLLHPRVEARRLEMMAAYERDAGVRAIVINAPLLYEVGLDAECDAVVFVESDRAKRVARARDTRGWAEEEYDRREKLQKAVDAKAAAADYKVVNNTTVDGLRSQIQTLFEHMQANRAN